MTLRNAGTILIFTMACCAVAAGTALGDTWSFRPGLWNLTTIAGLPDPSPDMTPEQQARLKALRDKNPPRTSTSQFCLGADAPAPKSMFDPANQPPGVCVEKILSESNKDREIEDDCELPGMKLAGATRTLPPTQAQARRHIILAGDGAGTIDRADFTGGRGSLIKQFRWVGTACGGVRN